MLFQEKFASLIEQDKIADAEIHRHLYHLMQVPSGHPQGREIAQQAQLCLRCFVSHIIERACIQLEAQFGRQHGFSRCDLFPFVLDELPHLGQTNTKTSPYQPLSQSIVNSFKPDQGNLQSWTTRLVRRHRELNSVLLEHGVYLVSDWAILNDTTSQQLERILAEFHTLSPTEIHQACNLLESYHAVYRRDRIQHRGQGAKGRCQNPTVGQLRQMIQRLQA